MVLSAIKFNFIIKVTSYLDQSQFYFASSIALNLYIAFRHREEVIDFINYINYSYKQFDFNEFLPTYQITTGLV